MVDLSIINWTNNNYNYKNNDNDGFYDNRLLDLQGAFIYDSKKKKSISLFPHEPNGNMSDRIINQMRYFNPKFKTAENKIIFVEDDNPVDIDISNCPVTKCKFIFNYRMISTANLILLRSFTINADYFLPSQIVIPYILESPMHFDFRMRPRLLKTINWTATYRFDATIVTPYFKFTPYDLSKSMPERFPFSEFDYSFNRSKHIAWFVSNCDTENERMKLGKLLSEHFKVDIYGSCGPRKCSRHKEHECFALLQNYMFYLSFENSNCRHYITEKFFRNALNSSVVPIVYGAHPNDYKLVAPPHSYIHIEDFQDSAQLVSYLKYLMKNKTAYNEYFSWKGYGMIDTNTFFWCRLCTMAHYADLIKPENTSYMKSWWNKNESCTKKAWGYNEYW